MNDPSAGPLAEMAALRARAARQERELRETHAQMARDQVQAVSADPARSRAYAFDACAGRSPTPNVGRCPRPTPMSACRCGPSAPGCCGDRAAEAANS